MERPREGWYCYISILVVFFCLSGVFRLGLAIKRKALKE